MPHPSLDSFFFWNSGSEAIEAAIKIARVATGKQHIIYMQGMEVCIVLVNLLDDVDRRLPWPYLWCHGRHVKQDDLRGRLLPGHGRHCFETHMTTY